jgi:hypothetical protein
MVTNLLRSRKTYLAGSRKSAKSAELALYAFSIRKDVVEPALCWPDAYAEILARPLSRRRFRTFWPSVVRIRIRNPCVLLRFRLFGWNVRFILAGPGLKI